MGVVYLRKCKVLTRNLRESLNALQRLSLIESCQDKEHVTH